MIILQIHYVQIFQFAKSSNRLMPRIAQVEKNLSESFWCSVHNLMNSNPITLDAIDDLTIGIFLLFDFKMNPLIDLVIKVFPVIMVSTNSRANMKISIFVNPNGWNSITIFPFVLSFGSVTLLEKKWPKQGHRS